MAKAAGKGMTKIQVVKEILDSGIIKASEIVAAAKARGVEISEATAANYKHQLGKTQKRTKTPGAVGRPPTKKVARIVRSEEGRVSSDLELENLALRLVIKAGSVDKAMAAIEKIA